MSGIVKVKGLVIGQGVAKICVPIVGKNREEIKKQAETVIRMKPDIVEWRCDCYDNEQLSAIKECVVLLRNILGDIPLVFTFRTTGEGGEKSISDEYYRKINIEVAKTEMMDFIDVEVCSKKEYARELIKEIHMAGARVIASNHDFERTPSEDKIVEKLTLMEEYGADICKIAVMPKEKYDVDVLIQASIIAESKIKVPIITMSMGELGAVTRVCTKFTGSAVTFAAGTKASAPGQIECKVVREILSMTENIPRDKNIMLIGFMGTGKTTVSAALRKITGLEEVDMDSYIVEKEGMSIAEIFEKYGESGFREKETLALKEIQKTHGKIVSCGGGVVLKDENIEIMKKEGIILLLTAAPEVIFDRVKDNTDRPILNSDMSLEHIKRLMDARMKQYEMAADFVVDTNHSDRVKTCYEILKKINGSY